MKRSMLLSLSLTLAILVFSQAAFAAPVPDTGQTKCYDVSGNVITCPSPGQPLYGQDANYTINPMYNKFIDNNDGTVTDTSTGLMWRQSGSSYEMTYEQALTYCEDMDFAGYTDWWLPTIQELRSLVDYSQYNPAINTTFFPNTASSWYWSSSTSYMSHYRWSVHFLNGDDDCCIIIYNEHYVRAVRVGWYGPFSNLVISPVSRAVNKDSGATTFSVTNTGDKTMPWTAAVTSGGSWLSITSGGAGTDSGTITCSYKASTNLSAARTATIRITATGSYNSPQDVTVVQAPTTGSGGNIGGTVADLETGSPIAGAVISTPDSGQAQSQSDGTFLLALYPGVYDVTISKTGYETITLSNVVVTLNKTTNLDIKMTPPGPLNFVSTTTSPPPGEVGVPYNHRLRIKGGAYPYVFSTISGSLPPGLALDAAYGNVSGTPTEAGSYNFTVRVTDAKNSYAVREFVVDVTDELKIITPSPLTRGTVGVSYFQSFQATGGEQPYASWESDGSLPAGLYLSSDGDLSATPTSYAPGSYDFTVTVQDNAGRTAEKSFHLEIVNPLSISSNRPDDGIVGKAYNFTMTVTGGYGQYTWMLYAGTLPAGLSFANGVLSGTPTEATYGTLVFAVTDEEERLVFRDVIIQVAEPLQILTTRLPDGLVNEPYSEAIQIKGGIGPYRFSYNGDLSGLTLNTSTGIFSGKPLMAGTSNAVISVTDSTYSTTQSDTQDLPFTVVNTLTIVTSAVFPSGKIGEAMNPIVMSAGGGSSPYLWQVVEGHLPDGVTLNGQTGEITGTPADKGDYMFTIRATDTKGATAQKEFSWHISGSLSIATGAVPDGAKDKPYNFTLEAKGGLPPYQWRIKSGTLPSGLSFSGSTGTIYGKPTTRQTYTFTVEVNDNDSPAQTAERTYIIQVLDTLCIVTNDVPSGRVNQAYTTIFGAALGVPPYSWRISDGVLPAGLKFTSSPTVATLAGTPTTAGTYTFAVEVSDKGTPVARVEKRFTMDIYGVVKIDTKDLKCAIKGQPYSDTIVVTGGTPPYYWRIDSGSLPAGLYLNSSSGHIYGVPSLISESATFKVGVRDAGNPGGFAEKEFTIFVIDPLTIIPETFQNAIQGSSYQAQLRGTGGIPPYKWRVIAGLLPEGVDINQSTGLISGTPVLCGFFDFTVELTDSAAIPNSTSGDFQLKVLRCLDCPELSVTPANQNVKSIAGSTTFNVSNTGTGTMAWTAAVIEGGSWLSITSGAAGSNTGTITCKYLANSGTLTRTGKIRVTAPNATGSPIDVTVTQTAGPGLSVSPANRDVSKDAGTTAFTVSNTGIGSMAWTAAVTSGSDWLSITSGATGTNTGTITCSFPANTGKTQRTATIRVTAPDAAGSSVDVTVTQAPTIQTVLSVTPLVRYPAKEAGTTTFGVSNTGNGTMAWTAAVVSGNKWLSITSGATGSNGGTITRSFPANTETTPRTGMIRIMATGATNSPIYVSVIQVGPTGLVITPLVQTVAKEAGTTVFKVTNTGTETMPWTAAITSGGQWLSITSGTSGTNAGSIVCAFSANTGISSRTATIRVTAAAGIVGSPKDITITQMSTRIPISDTGQIKCYDAAGAVIACPAPGQSFFGQDGNYPINPMSFTKLDNAGKVLPDSATSWSMVKDNVTGLVWEIKTKKDRVKNYTDPHDGDNTYTWYDSNPATNGGNAGTPGTGTDTEDFTKALNDAKFGGFTDWRLPTLKELSAVINFSIAEPGPTIHGGYFPNMQSTSYWSSNTSVETATYAWGRDLYSGNNFSHHKYNNYYAMAVRGGMAVPTSGFADNGNGTVTDNVTGLMWEKTGTSGKTWEQSLNYCESLNLGGYSDWRLPTVKELQSIADYGRIRPAVNSMYFPNTALNVYWASTTHATTTNQGWGVDFTYGFDYGYEKTYSFNVRAVRGGESSPELSITPSNRDVSKSAGTTTFEVANTGTGTMPWTAVVTAGGDWLSITSGAAGSNTGTITCTFTAHTGTTSRTGRILVTATGTMGSPKEVTVTQAGSTVLSVTPAHRNVEKEAGNTTFDVSIAGVENISWTAAVTDGGSWLSITSGAAGSHSGTITCAFMANTGTTPRIGTIQVTAVGAVGSPKLVSVTQAAASAQFIGVWSDGIWSWNPSTYQWTKLPSTSSALMVSAGKVDNDAIEDVIGVWSSGLYVRQSTNNRWIKLTGPVPIWIAAGDLNNDGRDEVIGSWADSGVFYWDSATGKWVKLSSAAKQLAVCNIGGIRDDLAGVWHDGLWLRSSATASWQKIDSAIPIWITAGDITGDSRADIIGSYSTGVWCRNSATGSWTKITVSAEQLASGDLDGDGRDDLIGIWSNGVWVRYGATGQWNQIASTKPKWITTGKIAAAVQVAGSLNDPMESAANVEVIDLSKEWPGGEATEVLPFPQE